MEQSTPEGHKTPSPSIAFSRGGGGCADCGSEGRERRPLSLIIKNEEDDADDDEEDDAITTNDDSFHAESQGGSNVSANAEGQVFLPEVSYAESFLTSGSSRASGLANGTTAGCNATTNATPTNISPSLPPATVVTQTQEGEERDAGWGEATTTTRPQRRAARLRRALLGRLIRDDQL